MKWIPAFAGMTKLFFTGMTNNFNIVTNKFFLLNERFYRARLIHITASLILDFFPPDKDI